MNRPPSPSSSSRLSVALLLVISVLTCGFVLASSGRSYAHADYADGGDQELLMTTEWFRFHAWMAAHGRSYPTAEEKLRRFHIYRDNVELIEATNRDTSKTFTCGENQFTDLSHHEFLAMYTMAGHSAPPLNLSSVITTRAGDIGTAQVEEEEVEALPENVDWREKNAVTPVQDQGNGCNACWVFASVATMESAHKIKTNHGHGELLKLSEQEIVDCTCQHCGGGYPEYAFSWAAKNGIATESEYGGYAPRVGSCRADKVPPAVRVKGYGYVPKNSEYRLAMRVAQQPVAVLFDATDPVFKFYKNGIYSSRWPAGAAYRYNLDHAMAIIGYGEDNTTGQKYWIAKNSWGTGWGEDGYVYIHKDMPGRPEGVGGLAIQPRYPVV